MKKLTFFLSFSFTGNCSIAKSEKTWTLSFISSSRLFDAEAFTSAIDFDYIKRILQLLALVYLKYVQLELHL